MKAHVVRQQAILWTVLLAGCGGGPERFEAPDVDPAGSAAGAMELYDSDKDGVLSKGELAKCPGILSKLTAYDRDGSGTVDQSEIEARLSDLFRHGTGGTQLNCLVIYKGKPLSNAEIVLEPEPYLGDQVQTARGTTNGAGAAQLGIPPEYLPSHLRGRIKAVHYGTFKVRLSHPTTEMPARYNAETELGYETEVGNPFLRFDLK